MTSTIILRNSNVVAHIPTSTQLALGELAINTRDGNLFFVRDTGVGNATIITVGDTTALTNQLASNTATLTGLISGQANSIAALNITTTLLTNSVASISGNTTTLQNSLATVSGNATSALAQIGTVNSNVAGLTTTVAGNTSAIGTVSANTTSLAGQVATISGNTVATNATVASHTASLALISGNTSALSISLATVSSNTTSGFAQIAAINTNAVAEISRATTAESLLAPKASPAFTGNTSTVNLITTGTNYTTGAIYANGVMVSNSTITAGAAGLNQILISGATNGTAVSVNATNANAANVVDLRLSPQGNTASVFLYGGTGFSVLRVDDFTLSNGTASMLVRPSLTDVQFYAEGGATNVGFNFIPKGTSTVKIGGNQILTTANLINTALTGNTTASALAVTGATQQIRTGSNTALQLGTTVVGLQVDDVTAADFPVRIYAGKTSTLAAAVTSDGNYGLRLKATNGSLILSSAGSDALIATGLAISIPGTLAVTGVATGPTAPPLTNTTQFSTTSFVTLADAIINGNAVALQAQVNGISANTNTTVLSNNISTVSANTTSAFAQIATINTNVVNEISRATTAEGTKANTNAPTFSGEVHMANGAFSDPDTGVLRSLKVAGAGLAVTGGIKVDTLNLTGVGTGPTAAPLTNSTQLATTSFVTLADAIVNANVVAEISRATTAEALLAPKASPTFTGTTTVSSLLVNANLTASNNVGYSFKDANAATATIVLQSDNNLVFYGTNAAGSQRSILHMVQHSDTTSLNLNVPVQINSGASLASQLGASSTDISKHVSLFSTTYGFGVTSNRLNEVLPTGASHVTVINGVDVFTVNATAVTISGTLAVTGIATGPTAAPATNTTQFATTSFVTTALSVVSANTSTLNTSVATVSANSTSALSQLSTINTNAVNLTSQVSTVSANTTALSTSVATVSANSTSALSQLATINSNAVTLTANVATLAPKASPSFTGNATFAGTITALGTFVERCNTVTYASTVTLNWANNDVYRITLTGPITITNSGGVDGQRCVLELTQDATGGRTMAFTSETVFGTDLASLTAPAASKSLEVGLIYHGPSAKYRVVAAMGGF